MQIYSIVVTQMYFCKFTQHKCIFVQLMWVDFGLIGKFYTIIVAMHMNVLEII